jgi:hypothetical protein
MKTLLQAFVLLSLTSVVCFPQQELIKRISVRRHSYYAPLVLPALKELVAERGRVKRNHFYVGRVEVFEGGYHSVVVYWRENRALVLWEPGRGVDRRGDSDPRYDLRDSRRYWRLDKDVVPTLADIGGSSFLITRKDAREWIRDCVRHGERYVVNHKSQSKRR